MNIERIQEIATRMRSAIEKTDKKLLPTTFEQFPLGSCGDTALILGRHLIENGISGFDYVLGTRWDSTNHSEISHVWLKNEETLIDITADQFDGFQQRVFVGTASAFHLSFEIEDQFEADYMSYDMNTKTALDRAYKEILKNY